MIAPESVVIRMPDTRVRRVGDKQLIARGPEVRELNDVASAVWKLADGNRSVQEISADVVAEFDVGPGEALADVAEFLTEMVGAKFMRLRGEP
jgi:hypothetical protein